MIEPTETKESTMTVSVHPDGMVDLALCGNISSDEHGDELNAWVEESISVFAKLNKEHQGRILCMTDVKDLTDFDEGSVKIILKLAGSEEAKDVKTAVVGGTKVTNMALRTIALATGRKNLKPFNTHEEALAWLQNENET